MKAAWLRLTTRATKLDRRLVRVVMLSLVYIGARAVWLALNPG